MVARKSPEWLPPGFIEKLKVKNGRRAKYYLNVATGARLNTKKAVIHCAKTEYICYDSTQTRSNEDNTSSNDKLALISVDRNDSTEWLPSGWKMEEKLRKGSVRMGTYKIYIDPHTGRRFYSKLSVARYLKCVEHSSTTADKIKHDIVGKSPLKQDASGRCKLITRSGCSPKVNKEGQDKQSLAPVVIPSTPADGLPADCIKDVKTSKSGSRIGKDSVGESPLKQDVSERCNLMMGSGCIIKENEEGNGKRTLNNMSESVDELPPGWIKEIKTRKSGSRIRKITYYTDPVSEYVFYSKKDAWRYLETKDIHSCAIRPKKRVVDDEEMIKNEILHGKVSESPLKQDVSGHGLMMGSGCIPEENKVGNDKHSLNMSKSEDGLPPVWIKEIKISKSGSRIKKKTQDNVGDSYLKPGKSQQCKIMTGSDCINEENEKDNYKHSLEMVAIQSPTDELPPGWIKEIKTSNCGSKIRKIYINLSTGRRFYSKIAVTRYLNSIEHSSTTAEQMKSSSEVDQKLSEHLEPMRQHFVHAKLKVQESFDTKNLAASEAIILREKLGNNLSDNAILTSKGVDNPKDRSSCETTNKWAVTDKRPGTSKGSEDVTVMAEDVTIDSPATYILTEQKLPESGVEKQTPGSQLDSRKSKKRAAPSLPNRTSKRLTRHKASMSPNLILSEQATAGKSTDTSKAGMPQNMILNERAAAGQSTDTEADMSKDGMPPPNLILNEQAAAGKSIDPEADTPKAGMPPSLILNERAAAVKSTGTEADMLKAGLPPNLILNERAAAGKSTDAEADMSKAGMPSNLILNERTAAGKSTGTEADMSKAGMPPNLILSEKAEAGKAPDNEGDTKLSSFCANVIANGGTSLSFYPNAVANVGNTSSSFCPYVDANRVPYQSTVDPAKAVVYHAFALEEILQEIEPSNKGENPLTYDQAMPEEQTAGKASGQQATNNLRSQDSQFFYPFVDSWSDPCLEFAYKTLTGEIPVEDTLAFPGCFRQQVGIPYHQTDGCLGPSAVPNVFQNEVPPFPQPSKQHGAVEQFLPDPLFQAPGNIYFPSCSAISPQQRNSEARNKNYQTR